MVDVLAPKNENELSELVAEANATKLNLKIEGGGTRKGLGGIVDAQTTLKVNGISGVNLYDPGALTLVAKAGTPLTEIENLLASEGQRLAFEPMTHNSIYGLKGQSTIGGVVACNISGSRRIQVGACRDALIGVRYVSGRGEIIKNGGRVMKNVTGLDLVKLMAGSFGTLGVLSEVAFKTLPLPERQTTILLHDQTLEQAIETMSSGLGSPFEVTGAAYIQSKKQVALRLEGFSKQVDYRLQKLTELVAQNQELSILENDENDIMWRQIRNAESLNEQYDALWKISVKPSDAINVAQALTDAGDAELLFDWGGGLIWANVDNSFAHTIRNIVAKTGGHATIVRASDQLKLQTPVFQPQATGVAKLSELIRHKFDPSGILNPQIMATGVNDAN